MTRGSRLCPISRILSFSDFTDQKNDQKSSHVFFADNFVPNQARAKFERHQVRLVEAHRYIMFWSKKVQVKVWPQVTWAQGRVGSNKKKKRIGTYYLTRLNELCTMEPRAHLHLFSVISYWQSRRDLKWPGVTSVRRGLAFASLRSPKRTPPHFQTLPKTVSCDYVIWCCGYAIIPHLLRLSAILGQVTELWFTFLKSCFAPRPCDLWSFVGIHALQHSRLLPFK